SSVAAELRQTATSVLALNRLEDFGFPYDDYDGSDNTRKRSAFQALYGQAAGELQPIRGYLGDSGLATLTSSESYPAAHDLYETDRPTWSANYDAIGRSTSDDFR